MRSYTVQPNDSRWGIAAATIAGSSFPLTAIGAYVDAMAQLNPAIYDWTALLPGTVLTLPA